MSFPGLARLGLVQWAKGQDGELRARDLGVKDRTPVTALRKVRGTPALSEARQKPNLQQMFTGSKDVLGEASGGR